MRVRSRWLGAVGGVVVGFGLALSASAAEVQPVPYGQGMLNKLGRGITNVVTCPLELIRMPVLAGRRGGLYAEVGQGILHGAWRTIMRGAVGVFEVGTFFLEIPKHFEPIVQPEFVWAQGNWAE